MGENHFTTRPVALYGCVLLLAGIAYNILVRALLASPGNALLADALASDFKGKISMVGYLVAFPLAFCTSRGSRAFLYPCGHHVADSGSTHRAEDVQ